MPINTTTTTTSPINTTEFYHPYKMIITDKLMWYFNIIFFVTLCGLTAISGVVSNVINVIVFYRLGIKDSMSVFLFSLSLTDSLVCSVIVLSRSLFIWNFFYDGEGIDPLALRYAGNGWITDSLFLCSGWTLMFLSLERCVCVIFPFKVKQIFTKNRSIAAVVVVHVLLLSTCIPIYATHYLSWVDIGVETGNGTDIRRRLVIMFTDNRQQVTDIEDILNSAVTPVPTLVITFGSALLMIYGLIKSSKFRRSMASANMNTDAEKESFKLTQKTRRLVMAVLLLAIIFLICSIPRIIGKAIAFIVPEVNEVGKEKNLNNFIWQFARLAASLNASVNIVVYLTINSSYRETFRQLFAKA